MITLPTRRRAIGMGAALAAMFAAGGMAAMAAAPALDFTTHAKFFTTEMGLPKVVDPQVFVADAAAPDAMGPQGIHHVAGFRPAMPTDPAATPLFTAVGKPLGVTLGAWFGASGRVQLTPQPGGAVKIVVDFAGLVPNGVYDLFENHFDQKPVGFTPLDGAGTQNRVNVGADGRGHAELLAPAALTHDNAVLLVWHSDGITHGAARGEIGVTAHHHLIARIPN